MTFPNNTLGNPIDWISDDGYEKSPATISTYGIGVMGAAHSYTSGEEVEVLLLTGKRRGYFIAERNGLCWVVAEKTEDSPGWYLPRYCIVSIKSSPL